MPTARKNCQLQLQSTADHNLTALKTTLAGMKKPYADNIPIASGIASPEVAQVLVDNHYTYDGNGNRLTKQTLNGISTYQFDALNRLEQVTYPTYSEAFSYDRAGNRIQRIVSLTPQSQPLNSYQTNVGEVKAITADTLHNCPGTIRQQYNYDVTNRLQSILTEQNGTTHTQQFTYDKQGNLLQDGRQTYSYDAFNRTVRVETAEGNYQENRYDAEGLRAEMVENGELVKFLFAEREVVAETQSDGNVIRYIRGYDLISSDSEKAKTYYHYASDEQGSITHLVSGIEKVVETDIATGISSKSTAPNTQSTSVASQNQTINVADRILNRYEYDAFGNTVYSEEKVQNRFRYTGQQCDPLTQQYYLRARYYNPIIARFTQEDTYHGDGLNLYSYCSNNPLMYYDPSGHAGQVCPDKYDLYRIYREKGLSVEKARDAADAYKKKYGDYDPKHEFEVKRESTSKPIRNSNDKHKKQPNDVKESGSKPKTRLPRSNGHWSGEEGNSLWYSEIEAVNKITGGEGIPFVNGRPDFSKWAKGSQTFKPGELNGSSNDFTAVYKKLMADSKGKLTSQNAAKKWLKNKGLTPHHYSNTKIIFVPTDLHGNIPHIGSASDMRGESR